MGKVSIVILVMIVSIFTNNTWATDVKLHELESYRIVYKLNSSMMTGKVIEQCRKWGNECLETKKIKISMGPMTQYQNTRTLKIKDKIYNTNLDTGRTTVVTNPMYDTVVKSVKEKGVKGSYKSVLSSMGFQRTDNVHEFAGEPYRDYINKQMMGLTNCYTDDGVALKIESLGTVQTAVEFRRNDPGDKNAYKIPKNAVQPRMKSQPGMGQFEDIINKMKIPKQN